MPEKTTHKVLPAEAAAQLRRAASTPITATDPLARVKAIEQANKRIRLQYPKYFKEQEHENETL